MFIRVCVFVAFSRLVLLIPGFTQMVASMLVALRSDSGQRRCLNVCALRGVVDDVHWLDQTDGARKAYPVYVFLFDVCSWLVVPDNCDFWLTWSEIETQVN